MAVQARASHILVETKEACEELKQKIASGDISFAEAAQKHSKCPSGRSGGDLGSFGRGQMVPEFDTVVFTEEVGQVHGPIQTQFGYHLIDIVERSE